MVAKRTEVDETWRERAACHGMETELFFPNVPYHGSMPLATRKQVDEMVTVCRRCPVSVECWSYAKYYNTDAGIWGGVLFNRRGRPSKYSQRQSM